MYLGKADVNTYDKGTDREFLVSSGTGVFGSSTVVGANTRGEHGMLVVRSNSASGHSVLVSKLEETLYANGKKYQLSTNRYKDLIYPDGYRYVQEYQNTPFPSFTFVIHSVFLKKSIFMPAGADVSIVKYELIASPEEITLDIRPLFAHRDSSDLVKADNKPEFTSSNDGRSTIVDGRGAKSGVSLALCDGLSSSWAEKPLWFENIIYERDGSPESPVLDCLWSPGYETIKMKEGDIFYVVISQDGRHLSFDEVKTMEKETAQKLLSSIGAIEVGSQNAIRDMFLGSFNLVADNKGSYPVIVSGFPSVQQRARDTFISLPGLTLATKRKEIARGVLKHWLDKASETGGVIPSFIDRTDGASLGEIDSSLWFFYALEKFSKEDSMEFAKENFAKLSAIIDTHRSGSADLGLAMDESTKLLRYDASAGARHWMSGDASGEEIVVRRGYLVEIQALWYNALKFMKRLADAAGAPEKATTYETIAAEAAASFAKLFWNKDAKYLFDWVEGDGSKDDSIRPNAILAVSLPSPILDDEHGRAVFTTCWNELYTTYGLRTLDPHHDKFKGRAEGRPDQKVKARLRGMAWPWFLGQFVTAYIRFNPYKKEVGWSFLRPFSSHLRRGCLGGVAEFFDGTMPYRPNGDVISAISQGELLRAVYEDLM